MSSAFSPAAMNAKLWSWKLAWRGSLGLNGQSNSASASFSYDPGLLVAQLTVRLLDCVGLFVFRLDPRSEHLAAFFDDAGVVLVDCDQLFEVLDPSSMNANTPS